MKQLLGKAASVAADIAVDKGVAAAKGAAYGAVRGILFKIGVVVGGGSFITGLLVGWIVWG